MFVFLVANVLLVLNAGLVHNAAIFQESSSSKSEMAESSQSSSYKSIGSGVSGVVEQSYEQSSAAFEAASEQSYKAVNAGGSSVVEEASSSSQQYAARSMESYSSSSARSSDVSSLVDIINQCQYIKEKDYYLQFLNQCKPGQLEYIRNLIEYLNRKERCLGDIDYVLFQKKMQSINDLLKTNQLFDLKCDWATKQQILQQIQQQVNELVSNISQDSILYTPLNYICRGNNYEILPFICGMTNYLIESQNSFYSSSSSSSTSTSSSTTVNEGRSVSSAASTSQSKSTTVSSSQVKPLIDILDQCEYIKQKDYYRQYLNQCQSSDLEYVSNLIQYLNKKERCLGDIDYVLFQEKIKSVYDLLQTNQLFELNCDFNTKQQILQQAQQQLKQLLENLPQNSPFYGPLKHICHGNNYQLFPVICGLTNSLFESQQTYYSSSSSTTKSSSTSVSNGARSVSASQSSSKSTSETVSSTQIQPFIDIINQCEYFKNKEYYLQFLQQCQPGDLEYISPLLQYFKNKERCLGDINFVEYQQKIKTIYELLQTNQLFDLKCDLATKEQILQQAQQQLKQLMANLSKDSILYGPLSYLCQGNNYKLFPFIFGTTYSLFESQYSYYESSSSSTSTSSSSSCGGASQSVQTETKSVQQSSSGSSSVCAC